MYTRTDQRGNEYQFSEDRHDLTNFSLVGTGQAVDDTYQTVAAWPLEREEGVAFGRGSTTNPDRAEAFIYFDARSDDADGDGTPDALSGRFKLVVLNSANKVVATLDRGQLDEVRDGDPANDSRGDWGKPFPYKVIANGMGEVLGGQGHKVGIQIELNSGSDELNLSNSQLIAEGYGGELQN